MQSFVLMFSTECLNWYVKVQIDYVVGAQDRVFRPCVKEIIEIWVSLLREFDVLCLVRFYFLVYPYTERFTEIELGWDLKIFSCVGVWYPSSAAGYVPN